jgi:hypothetical protein
MLFAVAPAMFSVPPAGTVMVVPNASEFNWPPSQLKLVMTQFAPRSSPLVRL